jgi:hypothetical protein
VDRLAGPDNLVINPACISAPLSMSLFDYREARAIFSLSFCTGVILLRVLLFPRLRFALAL